MIFLKKQKVFCIGFNKTGTTSIERALRDLGYKMGNQRKALFLVDAYKNRNFKKIVNFCRYAEAFQDAPFSWPYTFIPLEQAYPNSKFILSIRDDADIWHQSLVKFHSKKFGDGVNPLTKEQMLQNKRPDGKTIWERMTAKFDLNPENPYQKDILISYYQNHNYNVLKYFRFKKNLLVLNIKKENSYQEFCEFLNKKPQYEKFPWENKTD